MSIIVCESCDKYIDSDFDADCFIENPYDSKNVTIKCDRCRERDWDREQERLMEEGPAPSLLDQQIEAKKLK